MNAETLHRPQWSIDQLLDRLTGENVRVAAEAFSPPRWNGEVPRRFVSRRELILPDNSDACGLPLYFEGRLRRFTREIGVVFVELEALGQFGLLDLLELPLSNMESLNPIYSTWTGWEMDCKNGDSQCSLLAELEIA